MWGNISIAFLLALIATFMVTPYSIKIAKNILILKMITLTISNDYFTVAMKGHLMNFIIFIRFTIASNIFPHFSFL